jgi:hypothetical protein
MKTIAEQLGVVEKQVLSSALTIQGTALRLDPKDLAHELFRNVRDVLPPRKKYRSSTNSATCVFADGSTAPLLYLLAKIVFGNEFNTDFYIPMWKDSDWRNASSSNVEMIRRFDEDPNTRKNVKPSSTNPYASWQERNREKVRLYQRAYQTKKRQEKKIATATAEPTDAEGETTSFESILAMVRGQGEDASPLVSVVSPQKEEAASVQTKTEAKAASASAEPPLTFRDLVEDKPFVNSAKTEGYL